MIRKRRGASSAHFTKSVEPTSTAAEPVIQSESNYDNKDENKDHSASVFAQTALSPTFCGVIGKIIGRVIGAFIGYYLIFEVWYENMALGLGRWIVGRNSGGEEAVKLVPQEKEKKVKRRRRDMAGGSTGGELHFCRSQVVREELINRNG